MLEIVLCSIFTVLPDYLYRRYVQHKRIGKELTLFSVWFKLRYGITACLMLTVALITIIFYYHPSTNLVTSFFRTIPILPEAGGRVSEVLIKNGDLVKQWQPLLRLDSVKQQAAVDVANRRVKETAEATLRQAQIDLDKTVIYAGVAGQVEQFALRVGDIVNPLMRAAGVLIPQQVGRPGLQAGQSR